MPMHVCVWGDRRESVSSWHFYVVLPQPISLCILNKLANHSFLFIFTCLIRHFLARCGFLSTTIIPKWKADEKEPSTSNEKIQKLMCHTTDTQRGVYGQISI